MKKPIKFFTVKGNHREIGQQIGEMCEEEIHHSIDSARGLIDALSNELVMNWKRATLQAKKYFPYVVEYYPQYLEELYGISEGSNSSIDELFTLSALHEIVMDRHHLSKCTSLAVNQSRTVNQSVLIAHNEDWFPDDEVVVC